MEKKLWKNPNPSSLRHTTTTTVSAGGSDHRLTLQEFLAHHYNRSSSTSSSAYAACDHHINSKGNSKDGSNDETSTSDRKRLRLMKNRESANRSRARKQALIVELESEVARLMKENDELRKEQEKLYAALEDRHQNHQKGNKLYRTLTAPF